MARPWVCLLTVPLLPLRPALFRGPWASTPGEAWEVGRERLDEPAESDVARTLLGALGALVLGLGPGWWAWSSIDQTGPLEALRVVIGAAAPILVLAWRDTCAPRVLQGRTQK